MKRYDEKILGNLLDRYERSLLYSGKNIINRSVSMIISKKTLPEYFDESALQFDVIHQQLGQLEEDEYIRLIWKNKKKGHILEKCELVIERLDDVYELLHRKPKNTKEQEILEICDVYQGKASELDCFLRQFSILHFHDSKIAEEDIKKAVNIISKFSEKERFQGLQEEEILAEFNIYQNPSWLMMKGNVRFQKQFGNVLTDVDLRAFRGGIGVSNQDIETIRWAPDSLIEKVVTVENLTSFHQWRESAGAPVLCIYLGGYHNHVKRLFLQRLYQAYPNAEYYHFGDIDCGGFRIWKDLCVKTGIPFKTLYMDLATYDKYFVWGHSLTDPDRKTLRDMMKDSFFKEQAELFARMLKQGIKLEQECIVGDIR